jgi:hypothetical protein
MTSHPPSAKNKDHQVSEPLELYSSAGHSPGRHSKNLFNSESIRSITSHDLLPESLAKFRIHCKIKISNYLENRLLEIHKEIECQVVSIYLINETGYLANVAYFGFDKNGIELHSETLSNEVYSVNAVTSAVAHTLIPCEGDSYGKQLIYKDISKSNDDFIDKSKKIELERLCGTLRAVCLTPINGPNRTFGVIRVINKIDIQTKLCKDLSFSGGDLEKLCSIAEKISANLRELSSDQRQGLLGYVSLAINSRKVTPDLTYRDYKGLLEHLHRVLYHLAFGEDNGVVSATLRLCSYTKETKKLVAVLSFTKNEKTPKENSDRISDDPAQPMVWKVLDSNIDICIADLPSEINRDETPIINKQWIVDNNIKGLFCTPLYSRGAPFGTLTLFTGHRYLISDKDISYYKLIALQLSTVMALTFSENLVVDGSVNKKVISEFAAEACVGHLVPEKIMTDDVSSWLYSFKFWDLPIEDIRSSINFADCLDLQDCINDLFGNEMLPYEELCLVQLLSNGLPDKDVLYQLELLASISHFPVFPETSASAIDKLSSITYADASQGANFNELRRRVKMYREHHAALEKICMQDSSGALIELRRVNKKRNSYIFHDHTLIMAELSAWVMIGRVKGGIYYKLIQSSCIEGFKPNEYSSMCSRAFFSLRPDSAESNTIQDVMIINIPKSIIRTL